MGVVEAPEVIVAASREEAVSAFGDGSGVTVVAGGTIVMPEITHGRLQPRRALLLGRAGLSGVRSEGGRTTIGATTTVADLEDAAEPLGDLRARPRRPRDPRPGHARRQPLRAAGRRVARAATCRRRCSRSTRRCARPAPAASAPSRSRTSSPPGPPGGSCSTSSSPIPRPARARACAGPTPTPTRSCASAPRASAASCASPSRAPARPPCAAARSRARSPTAPTAPPPPSACSTTSSPHDDALASSWYRSRTLPVLVRRALDDLR